MERVRDILRDKGGVVHKTSPETTVSAAVEQMCAARVGALLVCQGMHPIGIFTERDLMTRVILAKRNPETTPIADVMTREVAVVSPDAPVREVMAIMTDKRCRHIPAVVGGDVVGIVSIGDLVRAESRHHEFEIRWLTDYVFGRYPG